MSGHLACKLIEDLVGDQPADEHLRFMVAVNNTLARIIDLPEAYPVLYKNTRRAMVRWTL